MSIVDDFQQIVMQLVQEAANYSASGEYNAEVDSSIRRLRTLSAALNAALTSINITPRPIMLPPSETPEPMTAPNFRGSQSS